MFHEQQEAKFKVCLETMLHKGWEQSYRELHKEDIQKVSGKMLRIEQEMDNRAFAFVQNNSLETLSEECPPFAQLLVEQFEDPRTVARHPSRSTAEKWKMFVYTWEENPEVIADWVSSHFDQISQWFPRKLEHRGRLSAQGSLKAHVDFMVQRWEEEQQEKEELQRREQQQQQEEQQGKQQKQQQQEQQEQQDTTTSQPNAGKKKQGGGGSFGLPSCADVSLSTAASFTDNTSTANNNKSTTRP